MILLVKREVFCPVCEKTVILRRKNIDRLYHEVLCFSIFLTAGLAIFAYLIIKYCRKRNRCPNCETKFDLNNLPTT
ncbi:MAG: LITAF-like zinc ribbon domain-containing protein [Candidatus Hermodarchaeota archaeon]